MIRITQKQALILHRLIAEKTGGSPDLRDAGLLDAALSGAYQTFAGQELYPTLEEKAATLGYALIQNHAFVDGNKRIGMLVLLTFLEVNGRALRLTNDEVARVGLSLASGGMDREQLLAWIRGALAQP